MVIDRGLYTQNAPCYVEVASSLTPAQLDELFFFPSLSGPGAIAMHQLNESVFLHARVRSRSEIIGGIIVQHSNHRDYSAAEHAYLSGIAFLTSLALA